MKTIAEFNNAFHNLVIVGWVTQLDNSYCAKCVEHLDLDLAVGLSDYKLGYPIFNWNPDGFRCNGCDAIIKQFDELNTNNEEN